jgi:hypothetical protein
MNQTSNEPTNGKTNEPTKNTSLKEKLQKFKSEYPSKNK